MPNVSSSPQSWERRNEIRREREIGNWGRASEHIGRRWEELGFTKLTAMLDGRYPWPRDNYVPTAVAPLMASDVVQAALSRMGLPSPDVVVVLAHGDGTFALQSLDFKWDLEFASYVQIRASALGALLERDQGELRALLTDSAGQPIDAQDRVDGLLFAPDSPANRRFLASSNNRKQEYPIEAAEVIFQAVDAEEFFSSLPGWPMALRLAELDRASHGLNSLDRAERYYRLGAGLLGGVTQLQTSVFDANPPQASVEAAFAWLRPQVRSMTTLTILDHIERQMTVRAQLVLRFRRLARSPYRPGDLARVLTSRHVNMPDKEHGADTAERRRWMGILHRVAEDYRATIMRTGRRLVDGGLTDADALAKLEADVPRFIAAARTHGERLVDAALGDASRL